MIFHSSDILNFTIYVIYVRNMQYPWFQVWTNLIFLNFTFQAYCKFLFIDNAPLLCASNHMYFTLMLPIGLMQQYRYDVVLGQCLMQQYGLEVVFGLCLIKQYCHEVVLGQSLMQQYYHEVVLGQCLMQQYCHEVVLGQCLIQEYCNEVVFGQHLISSWFSTELMLGDDCEIK